MSQSLQPIRQSRLGTKLCPLLDNDPSDGNVNTCHLLSCLRTPADPPSGIHISCEIGIGIPPEVQCSLVVYPSIVVVVPESEHIRYTRLVKLY